MNWMKVKSTILDLFIKQIEDKGTNAPEKAQALEIATS